MDTPIILIVFNRPSLTKKVWQSIENLKPKHLFLIADGPRTSFPDDIKKCEEALQIVSNPSWNCELKKNISTTNLGVHVRQITGLNWVFEQVDRAIIMEDDCVPDQSWYRFAAQMLEKYADDTRVMHISGRGIFKKVPDVNESYYFSRSLSCWGWATWARAWKLLDWDMAVWPSLKSSGILNEVFVMPKCADYFTKVFDGMINKDRKYLDKDYLWIFTCIANNGLGIRPYINLINYLGCDEDATHKKLMQQYRAHIDIPVNSINDPIIHPPYIARNWNADKFTLDTWWKEVRVPLLHRNKFKKFFNRISKLILPKPPKSSMNSYGVNES